MSTAMKALVHRQKQAVLHRRRRQLLSVIEEQGGVWKTGDVMRLYRENGWGCCRSTARGDLQVLARQGFLVEHGMVNDRRYVIAGGGR
ncbi:hypothetical protein [Streptomyces sp. LUP30]|uniref:hypothetical protein n=1 Tax=Streptomyces sp. LUP30 TaxID=1890285 RepID=UPI0008518527|nr:hypothetical protein [Streptomyces sp. LUP30]